MRCCTVEGLEPSPAAGGKRVGICRGEWARIQRAVEYMMSARSMETRRRRNSMRREPPLRVRRTARG